MRRDAAKAVGTDYSNPTIPRESQPVSRDMSTNPAKGAALGVIVGHYGDHRRTGRESSSPVIWLSSDQLETRRG